MDDKNKIAAALAAVMNYIMAEEETAMHTLTGVGAAAMPLDAAPPPLANLWALSGRQDQMQMRSMMQLRALR